MLCVVRGSDSDKEDDDSAGEFIQETVDAEDKGPGFAFVADNI